MVAAWCTWAAPAALAAPKSPAAAASAAAASKSKKAAPAKAPSKTPKAAPKAAGARKTNKTHGKTSGGAAKAAGGAAAGAAATGAAATATASPEAEAPPAAGVRLPLMLRVIPSLPDNPAALRSRLDGLVSAQGEGGQGASVESVSQLGPDIYAFSLRCIDAEQCQRVRLAIESQREWVAGLQLDERRHIPRAPDRQSPAAR